jgi:hypothetical protein
MAYNILKGSVEGSVDQHADQEIDGIKIFKNTISASVFYDTDAQSPCATMKDVAIKEIKGKTENGILLYKVDGTAHTKHNLRYIDGMLHVKGVAAEKVYGNGSALTALPSNQFVDPIDAGFINHGPGLSNLRGSLSIKTTDGLISDEDGVGINLAPNAALSTKNKRLAVDPTKSEPISRDGQNLSDSDLLIISDVSHGTVNNTTLSNLYNSYINLKVPHAAGTKNEIQFKGKNEFESSSKLTFESDTSTLNIEGKLKTNNTIIKNKMQCDGAVYYNIVKISDKEYSVTPTDYTILCDTLNNKIKVILPPAATNIGRVIIVKKADSNKHKINSNEVSILCKEGYIDITDYATVKMNYSSRTLQSDGENWWIIGTKGT